MATRYVNASTGSNANAGTSSGAAWATLTYANAQISAGDTVKIAPGTYNEEWIITKANSVWEHDGTAGTVYVDGRYDPVEAFSNSLTHILAPDNASGRNWVRSTWGNIYNALVQVKANGVTIDGKSKWGIQIQNVCGEGLSTNPGFTGITIKYTRVDFTYTGSWRIHSDSTLIEHCCSTRSGMMYYDPDRNNFLGAGVGPAAVPSAVLCLDGDGATIRDMLCCMSYGEGIVAGKRSTNVTIEDSESHNNNHVHIYCNYSRGAIIRRNLIWGHKDHEVKIGDGIGFGDETRNDSAQYITQYGARNPKIYNNVVLNAGRCFILRGNPVSTNGNYQTVVDGAYIGFNTFIANDVTLVAKAAFDIGISHGAGRLLVENNIIDVMPGKGITPVIWQSTGANVGIRNNIWRSQPITAARGVNDVYGNPNLINSAYAPPALNYSRNAATFTPPSLRASATFYQLLGTSNAYNAASGSGAFNGNTPPTITTDFESATRGTSRDIGAWEFDGTPPDVSDTLTASFTASASSGTAPVDITFTDTSNSTGTVNYWAWDFGDGETSSEENPVHTYNEPGVYTPTLIVRDDNGLEDDVTGSAITVAESDPGGGGTTEPGGFAMQRFTAPTVTGEGSVVFDNLDGATPRAIIALMVSATATETVTAGSMWAIGYATGSGNNNQFCLSNYAADNAATSTTKNRPSPTAGAVLVAIDSAGDKAGELKILSFDSDTVYYKVDTAFASGYQCIFLALGGNGVSSSVSTNNALGAAGSSAPLNTPPADLAMLLGSFHTGDQGNDDAEISLGFANQTSQYAFNWYDKHNSADTVLQSWTGPEGFIGRSRHLGNARIKMLTMSSNPTYEVSEANLNLLTRTLMLRLPAGQETTIEQQIAPSSTGSVAYSLGYEPGVIILWGGLNPDADNVRWTNTNNSAFWMGFVTTNKSHFICITSEDGVATSNTQVWTGDALEVYAGGNTKVIDADFSLTETGYLATWNTTRATTFNVAAIEVGDVGSPDPVVGIDVYPATGYQLMLFSFASTTNANGNTITGYEWDFGDGETATGATATHLYAEPGLYDITLTVTITGGETFSLTLPGGVSVYPNVEITRVIEGPYVPHPSGVNYDTPTYAGIDPDGDLPGVISFKLTATETRYGISLEDVTSAVPGVVRQVYDPAINGFRWIRPDGSTATYVPTWGGGGGTGDTPPDAPVLNAISNGDGDGDYTVDWDAVSGADSYTLQEKLGAGSYATIYTGTDTSFNVTGNASGTWTYRVSATDGSLTSGWSTVKTATVTTSATVTLSPSASNHDAWEGAGVVDIDDAFMPITAGTRWAGLYVDATAYLAAFPGKITNATLKYYCTSTTYDNPNQTWYGNDVDTAGVFTTAASSISTRTLTTASVADTATDVGTTVRSIDVTGILQEITSRAGWTGPVALLADGNSASSCRIYTYDNGGGTIWKIEVTYTT